MHQHFVYAKIERLIFIIVGYGHEKRKQVGFVPFAGIILLRVWQGGPGDIV